MAKHIKQHLQTNLSRLRMIDAESGDLRFVIETPKGCRNKYRYEPDQNNFGLTTVLPEGMTFPFDFGFVPSTIAEDGDPVDILVLMDAPVSPGIVISGRVIGALIASQKEDGEDWKRNDRLLAVATHPRTHDNVRKISNLRENTLNDSKEFFVDYNKLRGRKCEVEDECGPTKAMRLIETGSAAFRKKRRKH